MKYSSMLLLAPEDMFMYYRSYLFTSTLRTYTWPPCHSAQTNDAFLVASHVSKYKVKHDPDGNQELEPNVIIRIRKAVLWRSALKENQPSSLYFLRGFSIYRVMHSKVVRKRCRWLALFSVWVLCSYRMCRDSTLQTKVKLAVCHNLFVRYIPPRLRDCTL